jgi:hypothetical protein
MVFIGQPNLYVRISNKYVQRATGKKGFTFDGNGEYETDNELISKLLKQHFEVKEENSVTDDKPEEEKATKHCKKCDFTCDNQGQLLAHYREAHPKEG